MILKTINHEFIRNEKSYQEIIENSTIELIASGGISNIEDVQKMKKIGCAGTIIGKAIYEGRISLEDLRSTILDF